MVCLFLAEIKWGELGVFTLFNIRGGIIYAFLVTFAKITILKFKVMKKKLYVAPQCEVMELELQGMIAASGDFEVPGIPGTNY